VINNAILLYFSNFVCLLGSRISPLPIIKSIKAKPNCVRIEMQTRTSDVIQIVSRCFWINNVRNWSILLAEKQIKGFCFTSNETYEVSHTN